MKLFKNGNTHLYIGLFLTLINSVVLAYIVYSGVNLQVKASENKDKIVIEKAASEDLNKLSSQIVYSGAKGSDTSYYSPSLDALIKYDNEKYFLTENKKNISITPSKSYNLSLFTEINVVNKTSEDILDIRYNYYSDIYDNTKKEGDGRLGSLSYVKLLYTFKSIFDSKKTTTQYVEIIKREIGDKVLFAEIKYTNEKDLLSIQDQIVSILNSAELSPKNIEQNIKVGVKDIGLEFQYDRSLWNVTSHYDSYLYMTFISDNETNKDLKSSYSSFNISGGKNYNNKKEADYLSEYIGYDKDSHKDDKFTMLEDKKEEDVSGVKFVYSTYSYLFAGEKVNIKQMVGIKGDSYIIIKLTTPTFDSQASKEFEKILKTFKYNEVLALNPNAVLGTGTLEIDKAAIIGKPAVVHILNRTCTTIKVVSDKALPKSGGKSYEICSAGTGTGFYVSNDGYIVTNGHVATPDPIDSTTASIASGGVGNTFWYDFAYDVGYILSSQGASISNYSEQQLLFMVISAYKELVDNDKIELKSISENYVENGVPFIVDNYTYKLTNESKHFKATTIAGQVDSQIGIMLNGIAGKSTGITKPDLAILKITPTSKDLPALKLSDAAQLSVGQKINVIGFPGSAENATIFASNSTAIPTITNGSVSAIKPNQDNTFNLVQIDASVSYGNSGGPILNANGEVVAVTTYKISGNEAADFNAGVSVEEVRKYLKANNVEITDSKVSELFESGINNFSKAYYKNAIKDFNSVVAMYPPASEIAQPLINISNQKIKDGEDKTPLINFDVIDKQLEKMNIRIGFQTILIASIVLIALIISLVILVKGFGKKKKEDRFPPIEPPTAPVTPMPVPQVPPTTPVAPIQPSQQSTPMVDMPIPQEPTAQVVPAQQEVANPQAPFPPQNIGSV